MLRLSFIPPTSLICISSLYSCYKRLMYVRNMTELFSNSCYRLLARFYAMWPVLSMAEDMWFSFKVSGSIHEVLLRNLHPHGKCGSARIYTLWDVHLWLFWLRIHASIYLRRYAHTCHMGRRTSASNKYIEV